MATHFGITAQELANLFYNFYDQQALDELKQVGGVAGLAKRLKTNVKHGISDDVEQRQAEFGKNVTVISKRKHGLAGLFFKPKATEDNAEHEKKYSVIRNGEKKLIEAADIVVGDVVELEDGYWIPADGLCIEGECDVDNSMWTGEKEHIVTGKDFPFFLKGAVVVKGKATMLVGAVGRFTQYGLAHEHPVHDG